MRRYAAKYLELIKQPSSPDCYNETKKIIMNEFEIEADNEYEKRRFRLKSIGNQWYEIYDQENDSLGQIKIDDQNHEHCETNGCTLDMPILNSIRKNILLYKIFGED